jgi:lipopolysaccharide/colanic/teichoic acid biosynthesis glycosyltransferase
LAGRSYERWKRSIDVTLAAVGLIVLSPVMAAVALAVRRSLGRPVLFRQERPGIHGRQFTLVKFRTMRGMGPEGDAASDGKRMTRVGSFLRSTSLDELPELVNVLRGDMSLVGPRPLLMRYLDRYSARQARRHEVRPGITGLAQVNGRNALTWEQKLELDVWYVDHRSLALDLRILVRTVADVWRREGVNQPGSATVEEFTGTIREGDEG